MLTIGATLDGRYEILAHLAEGGMGTVYRARRVHLGDEVAIKVLQPSDASPTLRERFLRESRIAAQLRHPHVVAILDFNVDPGGWPYLVMELLNGRSLRQDLADGGPFELARVQAIVPPLCTALQMAHDRGILHRDLKPANIVGHRFESDETVYKIIDFGLANMRAASDETRLTAAHHFVGTISYASPEQLRDQPLDARSDIYSLGVVVFELLTGRPPFEGTDPMVIVTGHLTGEPPKVSAVRPAVPAWIDGVVAKALAKRPEDRWGSMLEFGRALEGGPASTVDVRPAPAAWSAFFTDKYQIDRPIARGRLGSEVYAGLHRALGHPVAIRIVRREGRRDWNAVRTRFLREARTLQVAHPSILQVRDYGEDTEMVYVVTDLIEGVSLREMLDRDGPVAWPRLNRLVAQLVDAAIAVHRRGGLIVALSPDIVRVQTAGPGGREAGEGEEERVLVSSGGICQVQDLLATLDERTLRGTELVDAELRYVAPEVLMGQPPDARADVYTIGALAYEMATGHVPFDASSLPQLVGVILGGTAPDPRGRQPSLPEAASACLLRCLARDPAARFASAKELAQAWAI